MKIFVQNIPQALSDPFYYIKNIYNDDTFNYHIHGGEQSGVIYPVGYTVNQRVSKGPPDNSGNILAILDDSLLKFEITYYPIEDHTTVMMDPQVKVQ